MKMFFPLQSCCFPRYRIHGWHFSFQHCCVVLFPSGLHSFKWEICRHLNWCSHTGNVLFFSAFKSFSLSLIIINVITMCLGMNFFGFILFEVPPASWVCRFMPFTNFGTFSAIIFLNTHSAPHSFYSPSGSLMIWHWVFC